LNDEFGCDDGACVPLVKRCNGAPDCKDNTDESHCETVVIDKILYHKEIPPLSTNDELTNVTVSVTVISLSNFNEIEMTFAAKFVVHLEW